MAERHGAGKRRSEDEQPEAGERPDTGRRIVASNRYSLLVGLVFVAVAVVALVNTVTSRETGTLGAGSEQAGEPLAHFAVPEVSSELEGDANIDPGKACEVDLPGAIRLCDFAGQPLVISFWFTRGGDCTAQQDVVSTMNDRYAGRVGFLSINVRDDREQVAELASSRGWTMPVGHDRDGALSNLYRVGVCPTFVFAEPGLRLYEAVIGELGEAELSSRVEDLVRHSADAPGQAGASSNR